MLDACHIVKLAGDAPGEVRRRVQQDTTGHRGRTGDPLYQIRLLLRASRDRLSKRQRERLHATFIADEAHIGVEDAYHCAQQVHEVFHQATPAQGRCLAAHLIKGSSELSVGHRVLVGGCGYRSRALARQ